MKKLFQTITFLLIVQYSWATTFTVTSTAVTGPGSLSDAIQQANTTPGADIIAFNVGGGGPQTVNMNNGDPNANITEALTIDGTTQPGFAGTNLITINKPFGFSANSAVNLFLVNNINFIGGGFTITSNFCQNVLIDQCNFFHGTGPNELPIRGIGGVNFTISNNTFNGSITAITISGITGTLNIPGNNNFVNVSNTVVHLLNLPNQHISSVATGGANIVLPINSGPEDCFIPIILNNCTNSIVENLNLTNSISGQLSKSTAIATINCNTLLIQNNIIGNRRTGLSVTGGQDAQILNNTFAITGIVLGGNPFYSVYLSNIAATALPRGAIFQGNTFNGGSVGIRLENMVNQIISDGTVTNTNIFLPNTSNLSSIGSEHLRLENCDNLLIENININKAAGITGIAIFSLNSDISTIRNCNFSNLAAGLLIVSGSDVQLLNNSFNNVGFGANPVLGSAIAASGMTTNTLTDALTISSSTFTNCGRGVYLDNLSNQIISDGTVANTNITLPNTLGANTFNVALYLNNIRNSTVSKLNVASASFLGASTGIDIQANSNNITLSEIIAFNRGTGINILNATNITTNCSFIGFNTQGFRIQAATGITITNNNLACNTTAIVGFDAASTIDAANNYWAANDGALTNGGAGDTYTGAANISNTTTILTNPAACAPNLTPEINIQGNSNDIADNNNTPTLSNDTDFGNVSICKGTVTRTYTIQNTGGVDLSVTNITSSNAAFALTTPVVPLTITAGNSITFDVTFTPSILGTNTTTITLNNSDCKEAIYNFDLSANVNNGNGDLLRDDALNFDGINDQIVVSNDPALNITGDLTLEGWFNFSGTRNDWVRLIGKGDPINRTYGLWYNDNSNQLLFQQFGPTDFNLFYSMSFNLNQWYHLAVIRSGNTCTLYVNGIAVSTGNTSSTPFTSSAPLRLGYGEIHNFLLGNMDEVRIWNTPRTEQELRENMHLTLDGCETGLVAYYQMNDGTGSGTITDKSNNGHAATLTNMDPTTDWVTSGVNVGDDAANNSISQTIMAVPSGTSTQNFVAANAVIRFFQHSGVEDVTITYQEFTPNTITGVNGINIIQNPMWTVNKSTSTETFVADYTFTFPLATFTSLDPAKYSLYHRTMHSDGLWTKIAMAHSVTATTVGFGKINLTGQFMVVQESDNLVSDLRGNMYTFDGINDHISFANSINIGTDYTIETWFKTSASGSQTLITMERTPGVGSYLHFSLEPSGTIRYLHRVPPGSSGGVNVFSPLAYNDGTWHHAAIVKANAQMSMYIDGVLVASGSNPNHINNNVLPIIGQLSPTAVARHFNGSIDEFRIWTVARTQAELRENMHLTLKGNELGLTAYYQFNNDDAVGTVNGVKDASGNGTDGSAQNMDPTALEASEVAVSGGVSDRMTIAASGAYSFVNSDVDINFGTTTPNGEIVVYRLETEKPHGWESIIGDVDNEYFVVRNFGINSNFSQLNDITFNRVGYVSSADVGLPQATSPLQLYKRNSNAFGASWGITLGGADAATAGTNGSISFDGNNPLTSFSQIVLVNSNSNSDLPVEFLNFGAKRNNLDLVQLDWATASETNNKGFYIERMLENETAFETITFVDGQGTTTATSYYQITDANSYSDVSYYRLRQVDFDGTIAYSAIKAVAGNKIAQNGFVDLSVYPNPVTDFLSIRFNELPSPAQAVVQITGSNGQLLYNKSHRVEAYQILTIDAVAQLPAGMYVCSIKMKHGKQLLQKFIKV